MQVRFAFYLLLLIALLPMAAQGQSVAVPNYSFESPRVPTGFPAFNAADSWTRIAHDPAPNAPQDQDAGVFTNASGTGYIDNADPAGADPATNPNQLAYLGTLTGNEFSQTLTDVFQTGRNYQLTVGVARSIVAPPTIGSSLALELYYLDSNVRHIITSATLTYDGTNLSPNHLTDFSTSLMSVSSNDPFANKAIGIAVATTGDGNGFFDLDNVRVAPEPASVAVLLSASLMLLARRRSAN